MLSRCEGSFLKLMKGIRELDSSLNTHGNNNIKRKMKEETIKMESIEDEEWKKHATHRGDLSQPSPRDE